MVHYMVVLGKSPSLRIAVIACNPKIKLIASDAFALCVVMYYHVIIQATVKKRYFVYYMLKEHKQLN